jgi:hypothetical protein
MDPLSGIVKKDGCKEPNSAMEDVVKKSQEDAAIHHENDDKTGNTEEKKEEISCDDASSTNNAVALPVKELNETCPCWLWQGI